MKQRGRQLRIGHLVGLICVFALGATAESAAAEVPISWVRLDNYPNGGTINNTQTSNTITVRVSFCGGPFKLIGSGSIPRVSGSNDFVWPEVFDDETAEQVTAIEVSINGDDWFWLDQIELFVHGVGGFGSEIWQAGADNLQGWCFSTDYTDGSNSVCEPDGSRPLVVYPRAGAICD